MNHIGAPPNSVTSLWPTPNYDNPESLQYLSLVFEIPFTAIAVFVVALRVYARIRSNTFSWDDGVMISTMPFAIILTYLGCASVWGTHIWDIRQEKIEDVQRNLYAMELISLVAHYFTKLSILLYFRRVFTHASNMMQRRLTVVGFVYVGLFGPIAAIITALQCLPISAFWNVALEPRRCINSFITMLVILLISCAGSFFLLFLPLGHTRKLQLKKVQEVGLTITLVIGLIACLTSLAKAVLMSMPFKSADWDYTWAALSGTIVSVVEVDLMIICASLPALQLFFSSEEGAAGSDATSWPNSTKRRSSTWTNISRRRGSKGKQRMSDASNSKMDGIEKHTSLEMCIEIIVTKDTEEV